MSQLEVVGDVVYDAKVLEVWEDKGMDDERELEGGTGT